MRREQVTIGRKQIGYLASETAAPAIRQHPVRTVVFLHAFPLTADMWEPNLGVLPDGWRAIAPDLRGFGRSLLPDAPQHRMTEFAGDVIDLLDRLEVTQAVLVACSMGGYVAFEMWKSARNYLTGLVLVSTRATADNEEGKAGRMKMIDLVAREGVQAVADQMVPKLLGPATQRERPDLVKHVRNLVLANSPATIRTAVNAMMERHDFTPMLGDIKVPAAVVAGAEDTLIPVSASEAMHGAIKGSTLDIIPRAGHLPNLEQTTRFDAILWKFVQRL
jgi:pimeloyl-ACP methyl ester carboxylesterase